MPSESGVSRVSEPVCKAPPMQPPTGLSSVSSSPFLSRPLADLCAWLRTAPRCHQATLPMGQHDPSPCMSSPTPFPSLPLALPTRVPVWLYNQESWAAQGHPHMGPPSLDELHLRSSAPSVPSRGCLRQFECFERQFPGRLSNPVSVQ